MGACSSLKNNDSNNHEIPCSTEDSDDGLTISKHSWKFDLKVGDQIDFQDEYYHSHVGQTYDLYVAQIAKIFTHDATNTEYFEIEFYDEFGRIDNRQVKRTDPQNVIHPLHSQTAYHDPKSKHREGGYWKYPCMKCQRKCCGWCFVIHIYDTFHRKFVGSQCKKCYAITIYNNFFGIAELLFRSIFHDDKEMEINVTKLIADYAMVSIMNCGNEIKECKKKIELKWSGNDGILSSATDTTELFAVKDHAIACQNCHYAKDVYYNQYPTGCDFVHLNADMKLCDDLDCSKIICGNCSVKHEECDGVKCTGRVCHWSAANIDIRSSQKCKYCGIGDLCRSCMEKYTSICEKCGKQICVECKAKICDKVQISNQDVVSCVDCYKENICSCNECERHNILSRDFIT